MSLLHQAVDTFASELQTLANADQVREKRREWLAWVRQQFQGLSSLELAEKRRVGQELNHVKNEIERLTTERLSELEVANRRDSKSSIQNFLRHRCDWAMCIPLLSSCEK